MALVGIDLGTTNSLISHFTDDGPQLIPNAVGKFLTPSVVGVSKSGEVIVGEAARDRLVSHPDVTYARFKRYMGTKRAFKLGKKECRAEELSALVLRSLKADAEANLGVTIDRAIISVPAYFNDIQRKATYAAGKMAGLTVERLINEPTAAALAYGLNTKEDENTFLVIDLGGGTFDVSILEIFDGVMEVRSSAGDAFLGGEDFTDAVYKYFVSELGDKFEKLDASKQSLLRDLADKAKRQLSEKDVVTVSFTLKKGKETLSISRETLEKITEPLVRKLRFPIQRAVSDASLKIDQIDRVIFVGGATRMPMIRKLVTKLLQKFPEHSLDPDEVIGLGAAVQAGLVSRHSALEDIVMTDVTPFTMGTGVAREIEKGRHEGGHYQPVIERNTVIPVSRVVRNWAIEKGQTNLNIDIYQGEAPMLVDNVYLGEIDVTVPKNMEEREAIDIRFTYDVSGVLEVLVTSVSTSKTSRLILEGNPGALSSAEIDKKFKALEKLKIHPKDKAENLALIARIERAYENRLGAERKFIGMQLAAFQALLAKQVDSDIAVAREEYTVWLDRLDDEDVF